MDDYYEPGVVYSSSELYDLKLARALWDERQLGKIFEAGRFELVELKCETKQWEGSGNIFVEYSNGTIKTGLAATQADIWVHALKRDGVVILYIMIPIERMKAICRKAYREGRRAERAGSSGMQKGVLISIVDLIS